MGFDARVGQGGGGGDVVVWLLVGGMRDKGSIVEAEVFHLWSVSDLEQEHV